jgi:type-F conjugative transfer system pilin assembly protein TrbC
MKHHRQLKTVLRQGALLCLCSVFFIARGAPLPNADASVQQAMQRYGAQVAAISPGSTAYPPAESATPPVLLFVSFSMPSLALQQYIVQANHFHIPMVIRGLVNDSFQQTARTLFYITQSHNQGGVAINPFWFRDYQIHAVPALVVTQSCEGRKASHCHAAYDVVYGNIPIARALSLVAQRGDASAVAKQQLEAYPDVS